MRIARLILIIILLILGTVAIVGGNWWAALTMGLLLMSQLVSEHSSRVSERDYHRKNNLL